jgi:uncharacterized protein YjiS (DUF1127 family)
MSALKMATGGNRQQLSLRSRGWLSRLVAAVVSEWRLRRQVTFLLEQDDRTLRDLGLCRSDVARFVRIGRGH